MTTVVDSRPALVEQWVATELGNSSYVVVDRNSGDAAVIDPLCDVDRYLAAARASGWRVAASLDTHVHNDFVSGGPTLRAATGCVFAVPDSSGIAGVDRTLRGGDELAVGSMSLRAIHSPGHTPEHLSYLLVDADGTPLALFSGGALMVGTMARPDLLGPSWTYALSRMGRETLQQLLTLPDALSVLPTHGGGSFCGSATSNARVTTVGAERRDNPLAQARDLAHFLAIHAKQGRYPAYYARMAPINRAAEPGAAAVTTSQLSVAAFDDAVAGGAIAVDCRAYADFDAAHVPGSLNVPGDGPFSAWVGWVVDIGTPVALVAASEPAAEEATRQLRRIGFHDLRGWLDAHDWIADGRATATVVRCTMGDLAERILDGEHVTVIDVRQENEWAQGHLPGAVHALAPDLPGIAARLDRREPVAVHCATGYRSALGVSMLLREGIDDVWHVSEGVEAWSALGYPLVTSA
ncbi:MBL fold metallo-hydrolase [Candidatus Aeolococcus gillhamiae]|uniref:MBL fold metallo-hydrolase n=1 Tax=Candidatus Aeolococcus gillhamiae TaxID=3127015 RepID=UPI003077B54D